VRSEPEFATRLRSWRRRRGWSQLELAGRAGISQRHLSFLKIGRASPSRDMVARLAATLDVPLRQHNELLIAAGFAPVWHETEFAAPELARVRDALDYMLAQQEPFPSIVVDRRWNLLQANQGALRLVEFLVYPWLRVRGSISQTHWSARTSSGRLLSTGLTLRAISFEASRPTPLPTARPRPLRCWRDCCLTRGCGLC
jgi:transcriptional regulator with XRE-family HTH domain